MRCRHRIVPSRWRSCRSPASRHPGSQPWESTRSGAIRGPIAPRPCYIHPDGVKADHRFPRELVRKRRRGGPDPVVRVAPPRLGYESLVVGGLNDVSSKRRAFGLGLGGGGHGLVRSKLGTRVALTSSENLPAQGDDGRLGLAGDLEDLLHLDAGRRRPGTPVPSFTVIPSWGPSTTPKTVGPPGAISIPPAIVSRLPRRGVGRAEGRVALALVAGGLELRQVLRLDVDDDLDAGLGQAVEDLAEAGSTRLSRRQSHLERGAFGAAGTTSKAGPGQRGVGRGGRADRGLGARLVGVGLDPVEVGRGDRLGQRGQVDDVAVGVDRLGHRAAGDGRLGELDVVERALDGGW